MQPLKERDSGRPLVATYSVPDIPEHQERIVRAVAVLSFLLGLYWISWRWTESLNWRDPIWSITLAAAETWGLITTLFLIVTVWRVTRREPPPAPDGLTVDVFITCFDEPLQLVRRTAIGARAIRYPHQTFVLDDGKRDEVEAMCRALDIGYIRREGNAHAKAGNLNNALQHTTGVFILQLDADHVPLPNILDRLLGYFAESGVAFVQSPQDFYNTDSFTHVVNDEGRRLWEENRIFFSLIQPGKDRFNAAFFCGSCGVLRRSALEAIGGFSTITVTEDMETSLVLHARGWKSVYHGETLAYGLAPASAGQYHVQRLRWGQGSMQILRHLNPLRYPGLSPLQRMGYFSSTTVYLDGVTKLIYYLAPIVFFLFGWMPVRTADRELLLRLIPYLTVTILSFELLARGTGYILVSERYNMTKFFTYILAVSAFFTRKPLKFAVTPKGEGEVPFGTYAPQLVLAALCVISLVWGTIAHRNGWVNYGVDGWHSIAFWINGFWVLWNLYFAVYVVMYSVRSRQQRADHRFVQRLPTPVQVLDDAGMPVKGESHIATTQDFNTMGISFRSTRRYEAGTMLEIPLPLASTTITTRGRVAHVSETRTPHGPVFSHGLRFVDLPLDSRDAIELHCTHHAVPLWRQVYRQSVDPVARVIERFADMRGGRRRYVGLPALVRVRDGDETVDAGIGLLEETSAEGARLMLENPIPPGTRVEYEVPGTTLAGSGTVVFNRAFESPMLVNFAIGVRREPVRRSRLAMADVQRWFTPARQRVEAGASDAARP